MADFCININEYFSHDEIKKIAEEELRSAFRSQFKEESDVERVISNLSMEYVHALVSEVWDGDFDELLRSKVREAIKGSVSYHVFRRKDAWDRTESPAVKILDDECSKSRPLIKAAIEKHIAEYPFHELDRDEITETVYNVIEEKIFGKRDG